MGKSGRKNVNVEKLVNSDRTDNRNYELNSEPDHNSVNSELEARLRRLENSHANGRSSSDVYKFAFFFFMGVALTIILYPKVSSTINSSEPTVRNGLLSNVNDQYIDDEPIKRIIQNEGDVTPNTRENRTKRGSENVKTKETATEQEYHDLNPIPDSNIQYEQTKYHDSFTDETPSKENTERVEDLMIGESDESDSSSLFSEEAGFKFVQMSEDEEITIDEADSEPQTVELFSANVADLVKDEPAVVPAKPAVKKKDMKPKRNTASKSSKKKTSKSKPKDSKNSNEDNDVDSKVPKEIRDFKPAYQKTLTPKKVFVDGRRIPPMELLPQKPNNSSVKVWMFEEFLSDHECDNLMRVHKQHVDEQSKNTPILCFDSIATLRKHLEKVGKKRVKVTPLDFTEGTTCVNATFSNKLKTWLKGNWSYSTAFYPGESQFATVFEQRVKQAMGLLPENGGKFQITSYPEGIGYKTHTDCTEDSDKRDRVATVLVYLDTVSEGGETDFPELGIWVRPRKGRALLWNNMDPDGNCEPMSIHKANKVANGHKYIIQRWYYYQSFYSLGKRPPEPPLPKRTPGQPRVSCDEYAHGSCRWYDEWNFDHVIEYERKKYTLV